jgi:WS/DGAT/MGAT family acyltransferase
VDDPAFDVADHVDEIELAGGDDEALRHYAEEVMASPLPADRPLWHLRFVTGLTDERVALLERVHHAMVDGVSGVDVATVLLDLKPEVEEVTASSWTPRSDASPTSRLVDGLWSQATAPLRLLRTTAEAVTRPGDLVRQGIEATVALGTAARDGLVAPRSVLNSPVGPARRLAWIRERLDDVKDAGRAHDATANDVVLASVAHGLRGLLLHRGEILPDDAALKVLVPVSLRDEDQHGTLGNRVGALLLPLPIGLADPVERLRAIARTTRHLKERREATTSNLLLGAADLLPAPLVGLVARTVNTQRVVNLVVTNVPGPPVPLYCRGARMLEAFPVVPLGGNLSIGVAILSYDGALNLGLTADGERAADLEILRDGIEAGFAAVGATWHPNVRRVRRARAAPAKPRPATGPGAPA